MSKPSRFKEIKSMVGSRSFIREEQQKGYKTHSNTSLIRLLNKQDREQAKLRDQLEAANKLLDLIDQGFVGDIQIGQHSISSPERCICIPQRVWLDALTTKDSS